MTTVAGSASSPCWACISTFPAKNEPWCDGYDTRVLLTNGNEIHIGYPSYSHDYYTGAPSIDGWRLQGEGFEFNPSHWMPLPPLPNAQAHAPLT